MIKRLITALKRRKDQFVTVGLFITATQQHTFLTAIPGNIGKLIH